MTFRQSAVRTILRLVDFLPAVYIVGSVAILVTGSNQRLGDLAAGTVVVRDPRPAGGRAGRRRRRARPESAPAVPAHDPAELLGWDVSGVSSDQIGAVRTFLSRREELTPESRRRLAAELAAALRPIVDAPGGDDDEAFLQKLDWAKAARQSWDA